MITSREGVTCVFDEDNNLYAIIYRDPKSRNPIFYTCEKMGMENLEEMIGSSKVKLNNKNDNENKKQ